MAGRRYHIRGTPRNIFGVICEYRWKVVEQRFEVGGDWERRISGARTNVAQAGAHVVTTQTWD